jgi:hypothetical protein
MSLLKPKFVSLLITFLVVLSACFEVRLSLATSLDFLEMPYGCQSTSLSATNEHQGVSEMRRIAKNAFRSDVCSFPLSNPLTIFTDLVMTMWTKPSKLF